MALVISAGLLMMSLEYLPGIFLSSEEPNAAKLQTGKLILFVESKIKITALVIIWKVGLAIFPLYFIFINTTNFIILTVLSLHIISWQEQMKKSIENIHYRSRKNVGKKCWPSDTIQGVS
jgi:hypothetical protein